MVENNDITNEIITALLPLKGQNLNYIGRAANMLDIGFGENVKYVSLNDNERIVAYYVIHIQTSWRFIKDEKIILAFSDFYNPKDDISYEVFQENQFGNSQFDSRSNEINELINSTEIKIVNIIANDFGDITIYFDNKFRLEVFVDVSGVEESWRLFKIGDDSEHFVVFDEG